MPDITAARRSLRRARDAVREPGLTALGVPVGYDNTEPPHVRLCLPAEEEGVWRGFRVRML